ncbi:MAG: DUF1015 domain-containing protein [Bacteroidota bacterium]
MAEIKPIRAWRYNRELSQNIEQLTSPLFDVVSDRQRETLYKNPYNSIHLSVPLHANGEVQKLLNRWKYENVIEQDQLPGIYVYYQYFSLTGSPAAYVRKGFICHIKAYHWDEKVVLRHENTMPGSVNDRTELLEKTLLNASPTHGLYTDTAFELESYMDESILSPLYETEDYQGVREVLSVIHDAEVIRKFMASLADKAIILADGHHRYEASLAYRRQETAKNPHHTGQEAYNYHLMYLTNTEAHDLQILPTHRLVQNLPAFDAAAFLQKLSTYFTIQEVENPYDVAEIIAGKKWAFGLLLPESAYKLRLKPEVFPTISWKFPPEVKDLDLTVLHYFALYCTLGIAGKDQRSDEHLRYSRNFTECITQVRQGQAQCAFVTNAVSMEEIKQVCASGYTLPPKSTYFYPKVICGFLFSSIQPDEFKAPTYSGF